MMLVSTSKFLALLALVASVAAAPASSSVSATTSGGQSSSATRTHSATTTTKMTNVRSTTTTPPVIPNTQTNGVVTEITIGTLVKSSVSGSLVLVTSSIAETVTLYPQVVSAPSPTPFTTSTPPAVTTSSQAATATLEDFTPNGSSARIGGGMGLAAIVGVAGAVAAVL